MLIMLNILAGFLRLATLSLEGGQVHITVVLSRSEERGRRVTWANRVNSEFTSDLDSGPKS